MPKPRPQARQERRVAAKRAARKPISPRHPVAKRAITRAAEDDAVNPRTGKRFSADPKRATTWSFFTRTRPSPRSDPNDPVAIKKVGYNTRTGVDETVQIRNGRTVRIGDTGTRRAALEHRLAAKRKPIIDVPSRGSASPVGGQARTRMNLARAKGPRRGQKLGGVKNDVLLAKRTTSPARRYRDAARNR